MTAQELIDYIKLNHYEEYRLMIRVDGQDLPVVDAWGIGGEIKITAEQ